MSRFYVDGHEVDVGDPLFHQSIEHTKKLIKQLEDYVDDYDSLAQGEPALLSSPSSERHAW